MIKVSLAKLKELTLDDIKALDEQRFEEGDYSAPAAWTNALHAAKCKMAHGDKLAWFSQGLQCVIDLEEAAAENPIEVDKQITRLFNDAENI